MFSGLSNQSKNPQKRRKRALYILILEKIISLREEYPNSGKDKIHPLLKIYNYTKDLKFPGILTINDMGGLRKVIYKIKTKFIRQVLRKQGNLKIKKLGELLSLDKVELRGYDGIKRYVVTIVDIYSKYSHAVIISLHSSKTSMNVLNKFPFKIQQVLKKEGKSHI